MGKVDLKSVEESHAILQTLKATCSGLVEGHLGEDEQAEFFDGASILLGRVADDFETMIRNFKGTP